MALWDSCGIRAGSRMSSSSSRLQAGRSSRSTWSPTPRACANSTWWCSTSEVPVVSLLGHACKLASFGLVRADVSRRFDDNEQHEGGERRPESHDDPAAEQHGEVQDDHSAV